jgi:hypothetical protein
MEVDMPTWATVVTHWKSTAQGILFLIVATCKVLATSTVVSGKSANIVSLVSALAFAYIALISKDSGVEVASIAGGPPQAVASHEVPENPAAVPVKESHVWGEKAGGGEGKD